MYMESSKISMTSYKIKETIEESNIDILGNSTMEFPTWVEIISKELKVNGADLKLFGDKPLAKNNLVYATINRTVGETPYGIDVPILLKPNGESKGLIIILGESALRTDDEIGEIKQKPSFNTILGTPYALHFKKCPPKCAVYRIIFDALLKEGYSLYITDIIKVWWKGKKGNMLVPDDLDINIFKQELQQFKNPIIVAWGKKSQDALKHRLEKKPDTDFLPLPHPGVNNWDSWKLRIFMKAVFNNNLEYAKKIYGKGPIGKETKTDEKIVANEAVRSIIEYMNIKK